MTPRASADTQDPGPDWVHNEDANVTAQLAADKVAELLDPPPADDTSVQVKTVRPLTDDSSGADVVPDMAITSAGLELSVAGEVDPGVLAQVRQAAGSVPVQVRQVAHSRAQLDALTQQISADSDQLVADGIELSSFGPSYSTNTVRVRLEHYTPEQAHTLQARYGPDMLTVDPTDSPLPAAEPDVTPEVYNRNNDAPPYYGGAWVKNFTRGGYCSTGFNLKSPRSTGTPTYVLTAAHCGQLDDAFGNRGGTYGQITKRSYLARGLYDAALIPADIATRVWSGYETNARSRRVTAVAPNDPIGGLICTDGAASGEVCGVVIRDRGICGYVDRHHETCGLVEASLDQTQVAAPADSGGPVYTALGRLDAEARGEIVMGRDAGQTVFYSPIDNVARQFGLRVAVW